MCEDKRISGEDSKSSDWIGKRQDQKKKIYIYRKRRNLFGQLQKKKETCLVKDDTTNPTYICALEKLAKLVKMSHGPK